MTLDPNAVQKTLDAFKAAYKSPIDDPRLAGLLAKSSFAENASATSGLTYYDLEAGAKFLYPVLTPLRNRIPRVSGKGGIQANWRAVTAVNAAGVRLGVSGGNRGGVMAVSTQDYVAVYKGIGLEDSVDFEAQYAGMGFDDIRAVAARTLLEAVMIGEEQLILGGNNSLPLGTTPTPTLAASSSGGSLSTQTLSVICVALTLDAVINGSLAGGIQGQITRASAGPVGNSDVFGGGAAKPSSNATAAITGPNGSCGASVAAVKGAMGYAWFWGAAGSELLGAITFINSLVITAAAAGTQTAASLGSADNSTNALVFDGLLTQALKSGSNAYYLAQPTGTVGTGTPLTADGEGGIVEIDAALKAFWDNYRLSPDLILVNSQEALNISKKMLAGGSTSNLRYTAEIKDGMLAGGVMVRQYLNRFSMAGGQVVPVEVHPNMPAGTILFFTSRLPYPLSNVANVAQIRTRQDYYQIEWPLVRRAYEYGVYADEVLQHYFPPSLGVITNIANG